MSKRAEEAAKEIYKDGIQLVGRRDRNNNIVIHPETMLGVLRNAAQRGYEQAQKDLALTWQDIAKIITIYEQELEEGNISRYGDANELKPYCERILVKFNELKQKK